LGESNAIIFVRTRKHKCSPISYTNLSSSKKKSFKC